MNAFEITYRNEEGNVAGIMRNVRRSKAECVLIAQRYMSPMPSVVSASVCDDLTETVVSKATEWQKRNG